MPPSEKNIEQLYKNTEATLSVLEDLISSINLKEISSLKSQVDHLASSVETLIKKMFGDGINSLETKLVLSEKEIIHLEKNIDEIKKSVIELEKDFNSKIKEVKDLLNSQIKDENEIRKQRIMGFWKWTLVVTPGVIALLTMLIKWLLEVKGVPSP